MREYIENRKVLGYAIIIILLVIVVAVFSFTDIGAMLGILPVEQPEEEAKETVSEFKILKWECRRASNSIWGVVKNLRGEKSPVTIKGKLYFGEQVVAEELLTLDGVKLFEEREFEIMFDDPSQWSACNVNQSQSTS